LPRKGSELGLALTLDSLGSRHPLGSCKATFLSAFAPTFVAVLLDLCSALPSLSPYHFLLSTLAAELNLILSRHNLFAR